MAFTDLSILVFEFESRSSDSHDKIVQMFTIATATIASFLIIPLLTSEYLKYIYFLI